MVEVQEPTQQLKDFSVKVRGTLERSCTTNTIKKDKQYEIKGGLPNYGEVVLKALTQPLKIRDGIQVTDINLCDRQKIFQRIKPKPQTPENVIRTATGTALNIYAQKKIKNPDPSRYDVELPVEHEGWIFGNIDSYDREFNVVVDIKTKLVDNESWEIKPFSSHEQQLKDLMALKKATYGVVTY